MVAELDQGEPRGGIKGEFVGIRETYAQVPVVFSRFLSEGQVEPSPELFTHFDIPTLFTISIPGGGKLDFLAVFNDAMVLNKISIRIEGNRGVFFSVDEKGCLIDLNFLGHFRLEPWLATSEVDYSRLGQIISLIPEVLAEMHLKLQNSLQILVSFEEVFERGKIIRGLSYLLETKEFGEADQSVQGYLLHLLLSADFGPGNITQSDILLKAVRKLSRRGQDTYVKKALARIFVGVYINEPEKIKDLLRYVEVRSLLERVVGASLYKFLSRYFG